MNDNIKHILGQGLISIVVAIVGGSLTAYLAGIHTQNTLKQQQTQFLETQAQEIEIFTLNRDLQICELAISYLQIADEPEAREVGLELMLSTCRDLVSDSSQLEVSIEQQNQIINGQLNFEFREGSGQSNQLWLVPESNLAEIEDTFIAPLILPAAP
jgi:hypothetical protein